MSTFVPSISEQSWCVDSGCFNRAEPHTRLHVQYPIGDRLPGTDATRDAAARQDAAQPSCAAAAGCLADRRAPIRGRAARPRQRAAVWRAAIVACPTWGPRIGIPPRPRPGAGPFFAAFALCVGYLACVALLTTPHTRLLTTLFRAVSCKPVSLGGKPVLDCHYVLVRKLDPVRCHLYKRQRVDRCILCFNADGGVCAWGVATKEGRAQL